jgi:putative acetyltransferase
MIHEPLTIRPERREDYSAVHDLNRNAFGSESEARLVEELRRLPGFIPELSLVAIRGGRIVGHILFSPIQIAGGTGTGRALALAPMAVHPAFQRQRIGSELVLQGIAVCWNLGYGSIVVVGHPDYYPRFGFVSARPRGLEVPFPVPDEAFMVLELRPGALQGMKGTVIYPKPFEICDAGEEEPSRPL